MSNSGEIAISNTTNSNNNSNSNANTDFKRKRNFTEEEKNFLVELVQQHQQIITSKDNKSSMKILKDKVWGEIHQQFNENNARNFNNNTRTLDQLKKCWENLRTKAKREYKQLNIMNTMEENNLQHKIISIIGDELDHTQNQQSFEFNDSFAIDYDSDFNLIAPMNQNIAEQQQLVQAPNKPHMRQILVNKLITKQQHHLQQQQHQQHHQQQQDQEEEEVNEEEDFRLNNKKNPIIGKQHLIVEGKLVKNPEDVVVENENELIEEYNGDEDLIDEEDEIIEEEDIGFDDDLQYEDMDDEADLEDDVDEIVYEEDGMLTSVVRNKGGNCNNMSNNINSNKQSNNSSFVNNANGNMKRFKKTSNIEDGHSSSNHSNNNSLNNYKFSPQNKKHCTLPVGYHNSNLRNYSNGIVMNKSMFNKSLSNKMMSNNFNNNNLNEALSDLKLREQKTRLRMARLELIANRRRAQLELELAVAKLENERRKKQLLERQLENEQILHRVYRKKIDK